MSGVHIRQYWKQKGVTSSVQLQNLVQLSNQRSLYADFKRLDAKLEQLQGIFPGTNVAKMVGSAPNLLVYTVNDTLAAKIEHLKGLFPNIDIIKIIASSPHILTFNVDNIAIKMDQLRQLFPDTNIVKLIHGAPNLLSYDIDNTIRPKIEKLRQILPDTHIARLIGFAPTLLYHDIENSIIPKFQELQRLFPECDIIKMVSAAPPLLCSDIEGSVSKKLHWLYEMVDGSPTEINQVIGKNPRIITAGYGVVFGRIEFLCNQNNERIPLEIVRMTILTPSDKFGINYPGYKAHIGRLVDKNRSVETISVKQLEHEYGISLRDICSS